MSGAHDGQGLGADALGAPGQMPPMGATMATAPGQMPWQGMPQAGGLVPGMGMMGTTGTAGTMPNMMAAFQQGGVGFPQGQGGFNPAMMQAMFMQAQTAQAQTAQGGFQQPQLQQQMQQQHMQQQQQQQHMQQQHMQQPQGQYQMHAATAAAAMPAASGHSPGAGLGPGGTDLGVAIQELVGMLSPTESEYYSYLWGQAGCVNSALHGKAAFEFLSKSGLPRETLKRIWDLADWQKRHFLSWPDFVITMKLISAAQKKQLVSLERVLENSSPTSMDCPEFQGIQTVATFKNPAAASVPEQPLQQVANAPVNNAGMASAPTPVDLLEVPVQAGYPSSPQGQQPPQQQAQQVPQLTQSAPVPPIEASTACQMGALSGDWGSFGSAAQPAMEVPSLVAPMQQTVERASPRSDPSAQPSPGMGDAFNALGDFGGRSARGGGSGNQDKGDAFGDFGSGGGAKGDNGDRGGSGESFGDFSKAGGSGGGGGGFSADGNDEWADFASGTNVQNPSPNAATSVGNSGEANSWAPFGNSAADQNSASTGGDWAPFGNAGAEKSSGDANRWAKMSAFDDLMKEDDALGGALAKNDLEEAFAAERSSMPAAPVANPAEALGINPNPIAAQTADFAPTSAPVTGDDDDDWGGFEAADGAAAQATSSVPDQPSTGQDKAGTDKLEWSAFGADDKAAEVDFFGGDAFASHGSANPVVTNEASFDGAFGESAQQADFAVSGGNAAAVTNANADDAWGDFDFDEPQGGQAGGGEADLFPKVEKDTEHTVEQALPQSGGRQGADEEMQDFFPSMPAPSVASNTNSGDPFAVSGADIGKEAPTQQLGFDFDEPFACNFEEPTSAPPDAAQANYSTAAENMPDDSWATFGFSEAPTLEPASEVESAKSVAPPLAAPETMFFDDDVPFSGAKIPSPSKDAVSRSPVTKAISVAKSQPLSAVEEDAQRLARKLAALGYFDDALRCQANGNALGRLELAEERKRDAVARDDFEGAISIRAEIQELTNACLPEGEVEAWKRLVASDSRGDPLGVGSTVQQVRDRCQFVDDAVSRAALGVALGNFQRECKLPADVDDLSQLHSLIQRQRRAKQMARALETISPADIYRFVQILAVCIVALADILVRCAERLSIPLKGDWSAEERETAVNAGEFQEHVRALRTLGRVLWRVNLCADLFLPETSSCELVDVDGEELSSAESLDALTELYKDALARRHEVRDSWAQLRRSLEELAPSTAASLEPGATAFEVQSSGDQKQRPAAMASVPLCGLCLLPCVPFGAPTPAGDDADVVGAVSAPYRGGIWHVSCANFWAGHCAGSPVAQAKGLEM